MSSKALAINMLAAQGRVNSYAIRNPKLTEQEKHLIADAMYDLRSKPIYICDKAGISVSEVTSISRQQVKENNIQVFE